jgi:hypothetical protein
MTTRMLLVGIAALAVATALAGFGFRATRESHNQRALVPIWRPTPSQRECGVALVRDWYLDGRVDNVYAADCYGAALGVAEPAASSMDYSTFVPDITAAYRLRESKPSP